MEILKPIFRWTIGPVKPAGFDCLAYSVQKLRKLYDCEPVVCHNRLSAHQLQLLEKLNVKLVDQAADQSFAAINPIGVAWKLVPPRLALDRRELFIDNDLVIVKRIAEIDYFLEHDTTLVLEAESRNYGQFDRHVPPGKNINSGLFGIPPGFDLQKFIDFYVDQWQENAGRGFELSKTFDEQGLVAFALLSYHASCLVSQKTITNCERAYHPASGMHFVGLNRSKHHHAFMSYKSTMIKMHL